MSCENELTLSDLKDKNAGGNVTLMVGLCLIRVLLIVYH